MVGIIEETGRQVENLKVGDRVFGRLPLDHIGAFAEYVAVDSQALAKVPDYLSDEEAAAVKVIESVERARLRKGYRRISM